MKGICKHYGEEFDCCKLLSDFSNPMTDLRPCTKDEYECKYYKPHTNFDRITENEGVLAEHMVHLCYETYYDCNRCEMDSRPYYTTVTGACYYTKEGAIQHTIEWLQKEAENG